MKTPTATITKVNTSAGFDSITGVPVPLLFMSSGTNHLKVPKALESAVVAKLGSELMGANPHCRMRVALSIGDDICLSPQNQQAEEKEILTPQVRQLEYNPGSQGDDLPPSASHEI